MTDFERKLYMKEIIFIVGKTASGKDTVARYLEDAYGIRPVVSYTTRPMRPSEKDGREHWFVDGKSMERLLKKGGIIAYTKNDKTGIEYCATAGSLPERGMSSYIINPEGIEWFKRNGPKDIMYDILYVDCPEDVIRERAKGRGDLPEDVTRRLDSERDEFDAFKASGQQDMTIVNSGSRGDLLRKADRFMKGLMLS